MRHSSKATASITTIDSQAPSFVQDRRWIKTLSDRIDRVLLSPWIGFPFFAALMTFLFQALFTWSEPAVAVIEDAVAKVGDFVSGLAKPCRERVFELESGMVGGEGDAHCW